MATQIEQPLLSCWGAKKNVTPKYLPKDWEQLGKPSIDRSDAYVDM
jgi:hypothetical protein